MKRTLALIISLITWFAVVGQFVIMQFNPFRSLLETIIGFSAYFTIQTNAMVALALTMVYFNPSNKIHAYLTRPRILTAITVYITVTGLIYNIILRSIWHPEGIQKVIDELLHSLIPTAMIIFWIRFVARENLPWKSVWPWLIYPGLYLMATLGYGAYVQRYPYPFIDVTALGYGRVFLNSLFVALLFLALSFGYVAISKHLSRSRQAS